MKTFQTGESVRGKIRILIAKPGLDGHETGAKIISRALRDAGMEVIYTGPRQTAATIVKSAIQEDVNVIGLSILSGTYMHYCEHVIKLLKEYGVNHIPLILGGIVHPYDDPKLKEMGVKAIFGPGHDVQDIIDSIKKIALGEKVLEKPNSDS
jgi:methylmalonyl-CoA mutase C-terminal domain/subunit